MLLHESCFGRAEHGGGSDITVAQTEDNLRSSLRYLLWLFHDCALFFNRQNFSAKLVLFM
jgi:hypothetical protein